MMSPTSAAGALPKNAPPIPEIPIPIKNSGKFSKKAKTKTPRIVTEIPINNAFLLPCLSTNLPAGSKINPCIKVAAAMPAPIAAGPRPKPSVTNSGIKELRIPKTAQPVPIEQRTAT